MVSAAYRSKFNGSKQRRYPGRPDVGKDVVQLVIRMARENTGWGYDRIAEALFNLGHHDQRVG
jgi:ribosome-binding protein aMBF1 (putative translation factor)